ncbi:DUF1963 domain-containing protein [Deinococcus lacus]|uniref:DUF1963 domain-containing protein n=1 Tax=Deinococcus lacus TaxID=392561 RepID=A0ABW1YAK2_9DEIO
MSLSKIGRAALCAFSLAAGFSAQAAGGTPPVLRKVWQHPKTGERVTLSFDGKVTTVVRGGQVRRLEPPAFDQAAAQEELRRDLAEMLRWEPFEVARWREQWASGFPSLAAAQREFEALGFPRQLWDDIDAFLLRTGQPLWGRSDPGSYGASSLMVTGDGTVTVTHFQGSGPTQQTFRLSDPEWRSNLLIHPTPALRERYEQLVQSVPVTVAPPLPESVLQDAAADLHQAGFVRMTARRWDGRLWLPSALEPYRAALEASEQPTVRLSADPGRTPKPWESKVGGVPYRLRGVPWPLSAEATPRPLVFLAQLNLAELNPGGLALPDWPSQGLLQFFILNTELLGADHMYGPEGSGGLEAQPDLYRVLYLPEVVEDERQLDLTAPAPQADPAEVARLKREGFANLAGDDWLVWGFLPFERTGGKLPPAVALAALPDQEPVSGADGSAEQRLGVNLWAGDEAEGGYALRSALYDLSPGGHKLGGYPNFTQSDPRRQPAEWTLLLQLDSDPALNLMWGDVGTATFFIRPADLKSRQFDRVAYSWDSG